MRPVAGTFDLLAGLPLEVDGYRLEGLRRNVSSGFERRTTVVTLEGGGEEGIGEDVVYDGEDHEAMQAAGPYLDLRHAGTLGEFCAKTDALDLFPVPPPRGEVSRLYRRWTFQGAALDLALRQAGRSLADVLGREPRPVTFVMSLRLGVPSSFTPLERRLERYPNLRFKLDPVPDWDDALVERIAATGAVDSLDFKSFYKGTVVDAPTDVRLYERCLAAFPDAWIEDPDLTDPAVDALLGPHRDRITWDAPIHSVADIEALPFAPRMVNVKPSRFGPLASLCAGYDFCAAHGIAMYSGGQFELGVGRGQAQALASLFHPDGPNDLAPGGYDAEEPARGLPESPLTPELSPVGFRWG
jgi:hypothetical protein